MRILLVLIVVALGCGSAFAQTTSPTGQGPWGDGRPPSDGVQIHSAKANCPCCCHMSTTPSQGIWAPPSSWLDDSDQEEHTERPDLSSVTTRSGVQFGFLPELTPGLEVGWSALTAARHELDGYELPIELDGAAFAQITVDELDVTRLNGWRGAAHYWHAAVFVQFRNGSADDTPFIVENPLDPRESFSGAISWSVSSLEVGMGVPIAFVEYASVVRATLWLGGGYYRMTVEPSGPADFSFSQPGPRVVSGGISYDDQTLSGLFATIGTHVRARVWRGLHVDLIAELFKRMGDAEATYLHVSFGASWDF